MSEGLVGSPKVRANFPKRVKEDSNFKRGEPATPCRIRALYVNVRLGRPGAADGHLEVQVTVDDPKAYTKPWTVTLKQRIVVGTELIDEICLENEKDAQRLK